MVEELDREETTVTAKEEVKQSEKHELSMKSLLEAGVHFGHLTRKWNPNMSPYIYMERNGIHIINLYKIQPLVKSQISKNC